MKHSYEDLKGVEKWCYFIKKYDDEISDPLVAELIRRQPLFKETSEIMKAISNDPAIRDAAFARDKELRDRAQIKYEGKEEGREEERLNVARSLLRKHLNDDLIIECTKVTLEQLAKLKLELNPMIIHESEMSYDPDAAKSITDKE